MKTVAIVGFGRFGKTYYRLLKADFRVLIFNRSPIAEILDKTENTAVIHSISEIYNAEAVFYCVPINRFESVIRKHRKYITPKNVLIDVLSVKEFPKRVFEKYINDKNVQILLTHPMFGPDSSKNGFTKLPLIMDQFRTNENTYLFWKNYFHSKGLNVVELSAPEHDKLAATSQGLTHFIGRLLENMKFKPTSIDSLGAKKLHEVVDQTCNDTWQLFNDLQHYNRYTKQMRINLGRSYDHLYNQLLPKHVKRGLLTFGIQGGKGSFNEEALMYYVKRNRIEKYQIKYLYTSANVLKALHEGGIDIGQCAIHNSVGGVVEETIAALAEYKCKIKDQFAIKIAHALMIRSDAHFSEVSTIMTHPQVLAQCKSTLAEKYPHLKQESGTGKFLDHALVAKALGEQKLPKTTATMGSKILAELYNLTVVEDNLQDAKENYTSFLQISQGF